MLGNFSGFEVVVDLPSASSWAGAELLVANYPVDPDSRRRCLLTLRGWETRVYRRRS